VPIPLISTLSRQGGANFPLVLGEDIQGGFVTVASTGARDAIPTNILRDGAIVRIGRSSNYYEWNSSSSTWSLLSFGGSSGHLIKDEGIALTPRTSLNFVGVNVAVTDDGTNTVVTVGQVSLTAGVTGTLPVSSGGTGLSAGGTNGQVLTMVSGAPAWAAPPGGSLSSPANPADDGKVAIASSGNLTYALLANANVSATAAITLSKLANGSACSVVGRASNSSGAHADIPSSADDEVFRRAGGVLGWGTIATGGIGDSQVTLAKLANGTALSVIGRSANSVGVYADVTFANNDEVLMRTSNALTTAKIADANISTSAAIAYAKLATGTPGRWLTINASGVVIESDVALTDKTISNSSATAAAPALILRKSRGTSGSPAAHQALDALANFVAQGHDGTGFYEAGSLTFVGAAAGGTSKRAIAESYLHDGTAEVKTGSFQRFPRTPTTDATLTTIPGVSVSVPADSTVKLNIIWHAQQTSPASSNIAHRETALTVRRSGSGNVVEISHSDGVSLFKDDGTWGNDTEIAWVLNNTTHAVEFTVKGKSGVAIAWTGEVSHVVYG
jgi:hypothetical protein